jgi:integrase
MAPFRRDNSPFWYIYLPPTKKKIATDILVGTTPEQRKASELAAGALYYKLMRELENPSTGPKERPRITFDDFADWFDANVIARHRGAERERQALVHLRRCFSAKHLDEIDRDAVIEYRTSRLETPVVVKNFGGRRHRPLWMRVHDYLRKQGPTALPAIARALGLPPERPSVALKVFYRTETTAYFGRFETKTGSVYHAVGKPKGKERTLPLPKAATVNREVDVLQQLLNAAVPKYLAVSPLDGFKDLVAADPQRAVLAVGQEVKLRPYLSAEDYAIVITAMDTLTRVGDVLDLKREHDKRKHLVFYDTKANISTTPPVSSRLRKILDALPVTSEYYFPSRRRAQPRHRVGALRKAVYRACRLAKVPYGRKQGGITLHWATRSTGVTRMLREGGEGSVKAVATIGGWKRPDVMLTKYLHASTAQMAALVEAVGRKPRKQRRAS